MEQPTFHVHPIAADPDRDRQRPPDEARATVPRSAKPLPSERVPIAEAAQRVLAEDHPPFAAATMDGCAVAAADGSPAAR